MYYVIYIYRGCRIYLNRKIDSTEISSWLQGLSAEPKFFEQNTPGQYTATRTWNILTKNMKNPQFVFHSINCA